MANSPCDSYIKNEVMFFHTRNTFSNPPHATRVIFTNPQLMQSLAVLHTSFASRDDPDADACAPAITAEFNSLRPISKSKQKKLLRNQQEIQRKSSVVQAFHEFYRELYRDRWPSLLSALQSEARSACLVNRFAEPRVFAQNVAGVSNLSRLPFVNLPLYECFGRFPHPERDNQNVYAYYMLDAASVLATEALEVQPGDSVLDLCAAPGGKSVAILQRLNPLLGTLTANEVSAERRRRLWKVIMDYIPENLRHCVSVTGRDGMQWSDSKLFDKVLVDAPCSSERHLLQNEEELYKWTGHRTVNCAKRQLALLNAGLKCVHVGGLVVYSTCSISYGENDGVIEKALRKTKIEFEVLHRTWLVGEKTEFGWIVLPDTEGGWGPLYFSVLRRIQNS